MAKPVIGSEEQDDKFQEIQRAVEKITAALCRNQNQKALRSMKKALWNAYGLCDEYLDIRNEQGRGGLKKKS